MFLTLPEPRSHRQEDRRRVGARMATFTPVILAVALMGCGHATGGAASPHGKTTTTAASIAPRVERLVVADKGTVSMVARGGCVATVRTSESGVAGEDELSVRCPKPERLKAWFDGADRVMAGFSYEPVKDDEEEGEVTLPIAKVLTAGGKTLKVTRPEDIQRISGEVRALSTELAQSAAPAPGPASADGWQMLHVTGPAHVLFAGTPTRGFFEARLSTNGQYLCDFIASVGGSAMHATKSGWLSPAIASRAIDEVLGPFAAPEPNEPSKSTYAAGTKDGAEKRSNASSTAAVFERFAQIQDVLGDACLPELEAPSSNVGL
jgi:hypothetical protein